MTKTFHIFYQNLLSVCILSIKNTTNVSIPVEATRIAQLNASTSGKDFFRIVRVEKTAKVSENNLMLYPFGEKSGPSVTIDHFSLSKDILNQDS